MRIRTLIQTAVLLAILMVMGLAVATWLITTKLAEHSLAQERAQSVAREVSDLLVLTHEYALYSEERAAQQWRTHQAAIVDMLGSGAKDVVPAPPEALSEAKSLASIFQQLVDTRVSRTDLQSRQKNLLLDQLLTRSQVLADSILRWGNATIAQRQITEQAFHILVIAIPILMLIILVLLAILLYRRVLLPLATLHRAVTAVTQGDLTVRSASAVQDELGELSRTFDAMAVDLVSKLRQEITERIQTEEELQRSNAELEQFSYAISHDMRQPLRMISSYLKLLDTSLADRLDAEKREYLNFAADGAKRLDQMLVGLLEYSRVGRKGEPRAWVESRVVLDEALLFLQPAIAEAQANIRIEGNWPKIFASPDEMLRLVQNLLGNALKFRVAGRTPEIIVSSEMVGREWRMIVSDNGVGIIPDQIGRLFQVFQRLQSRAKYEGTGLGLALCRKIVEHHGGRIWAESSGDGRGSRFCVELPNEFQTTGPAEA